MTDRLLFAEPAHVVVLRRMHLVKAGDRSALNRRILIVIVVAWVPLVAINLFRLFVAHDASALSFFRDIAVNSRLLLAVPLLIAGEYLILPRLETMVAYLRESLVVAEDLPRFDAILGHARRSNAAIWPSAMLLVAAYAIVLLLALVPAPEPMPEWRISGTTYFSSAGWWFALIGSPVLIGCMLAWLWRIVIWTRFLRAVSRLRLRLVTAHPDGAAGLQFLAFSSRLFTPIAFAAGIIVAGAMANNMLRFGVSPLEHALVPAITTLLVVVILVSPPLVFSGALLTEWREGILKYGDLSRQVGRTFERKWFDRQQRADESALAEPDFSSTTDLYSIVANVQAMRLFIVDYKSVAVIVAATLLPFAPIWLSAVPIDDVLHALKRLLV